MWMTGIKFQPETRISHCHYNEPCITREYHYSPHSLSSPLAPCYTRCNPNTRFIARSSFLEVVAPLLGGSPFRARVGVPTAFRYSVLPKNPLRRIKKRPLFEQTFSPLYINRHRIAKLFHFLEKILNIFLKEKIPWEFFFPRDKILSCFFYFNT